jgi:hypothetical protein
MNLSRLLVRRWLPTRLSSPRRSRTARLGVEELEARNLPSGATFSPAQNIPVGIAPFAVAVGDFNRDGHQDVAITNSNDNTVSVLLGDGKGNFGTPINTAVGGFPEGIAVGDFNRDGIPDLAVSNNSDATVTILLGNGDGTFRSGGVFPVQANPLAVAVGDFNGNGIQDLVVANESGNSISLLPGNGDGTFGTTQNLPAGSAPEAVVVGDFNNDHKQDIAVTDENGDTVSVFLGNGDGTFQPAVSYPTGSSPESIVAADFNHDGKLDLATSDEGADGGATVLFGNGDGTFGAPVILPLPANSSFAIPEFVAAGDYNGDGNTDLAVTDSGNNQVILYLGNGDGTFQTPDTFAVGSNGTGAPQGVAVGDFNSDGKQDLAVADNGSNELSILLNTTAQVPTQLAFATQPSTVVPGQLISPAVTVLVEDANGNVVTSDNSTVTIALGNNPAGALLGGTSSVQAVNGRATFTGLNLSTFGSGFTLVASDGSLPAVTSQPFNVNPITITATTNTNLVNQPVTFNIKVFGPAPFNGNPFGTVTLSLSDGTVLGTVPVNSNGRATFTTSSLPLSSGSSTTANVITAIYNDPTTASTTVTTVATSGPGVPVTVVLGPGASPAGAGTLTDGSGPGTLAGVVQTNSPLVGQFVPASDTLVPNFGDDNLFTLAAGSSADQVNLLTNFTTQFTSRPSFTVEVQSDIGIGAPVMQVFTLFVIASPPAPGTGGGVVHGATTLAVFDPTGISNAFTAFWYLGTANAANAAPTVVPYGGNTWKGVLGDWTGKGFDSLGVVDTTGRSTPGAAVWYLRNTNTPGAPDIGPFFYGLPTWTPLVGDWNGDGITTVGAVDTATGTWYLRNENSNGAPDQGTFVYGEPGWIPLAGDWTGSGHTGIGMFDPSTATFYLRNSASTGAPDFVITYGVPGWKPVVGDWDGNGTTTIAVVAPGNIWYIRNSNSAGAPDVPPFPFGLDVWTPASGRFLSPGTPEIAAGGAQISDPSTQVLSTAQLQEAVSAALSLLQQAGVDPLLIAKLASADYEVGTLPGALLGVTTPDGRIIVSSNAASYGWSGLGSPSAGQMDLLTVVLHEMTHLAGQSDQPGSGSSSNLLADTLATGVRRTAGLDTIFAGG